MDMIVWAGAVLSLGRRRGAGLVHTVCDAAAPQGT